MICFDKNGFNHLDRRLFLRIAGVGTVGVMSGAPARAQMETFRMEAFQTEALEILRRHFAGEGFEKGHSIFEILSKDHHLYLPGIYARTRGMTAQAREAAIVAWFAALDAAERGNEKIWADFDWAKPHLRPRLWSSKALGLERLARQAFLGDLYTVYVVDQPTTAAYVSRDRLAAWNIAPGLLHELALANLDRDTGRVPIGAIQGKDGRNELAMVAGHDTYDAARLLLPSIRGMIARILGPVAFAAIPRRDAFFAWTKGHRPTPDQMADLVGQGWAAVPLCDATFCLENGAIRVASEKDLE